MAVPKYIARRIQREIESRREAERLLEVKSLELYVKNQELGCSASKLMQQLEFLGTVMDAVPDLVITCNSRYGVETVNQACNQLLGYEPSDLIGLRLTEFVPSLLDHAQELSQESFVISDINIRKRSGAFLPAELRGKHTRLHERPMIVIVLHDITGRKDAERVKEEVFRQLHEARRLEAIGALASGIAHELNTPIQFIGDNIKYIGSSLEKIHASYTRYEALKNACQSHEKFAELVRSIDEFNRHIDLGHLVDEIYAAMKETSDGVKQVRNIVFLMKEFAHPGTTAPEPADINEMVKRALTFCRSRTKEITKIEMDLTESPALALCRKGQIQQVLVNLIVNAVEAIEERENRSGAIRIATRAGASFQRIEISDTGPGIPKSLTDKIFDPFFTTKPVGKGTGQGLALAKDIIVKQHGGRLFLADRPGFATTFVIELPAAQKAAISKAARHAEI